MSTASMHLELAPPPAEGLGRSLSLALVVHLLLLIALTWGIQWQNTDNTPAVEAELWSALPKAAAPPPPPPAPEPAPEPPPPPPAPKVKPTPPAPSRDADIAIAKQKKAEQEKKLEQEQLKLKKQNEQKEKDKALEQQRQREKEKLAQAQRDKKEQELKEQKDRKDKERKAQEAKSAAQDERKLQAMRDENLRRMAGMAGATGSPNATGDALRASGPSASYGGRIIARVKPNIVFNPDDVSGNPVAEVEVRTAPDGKIMSRKLIKSSGNKAWDEAVVKALDKTDTLPRDTDGTIPTMMVLGFKPRD
jgi:colicin import membrane protein